jgi:hypothetical protein
MTRTCNDCACKEGQLHEIFCLEERCPFCGDQLVGCGCISTVLQLTPEEQVVLDAYVDDSVEPLLGINTRWVKALNRKGRVPF